MNNARGCYDIIIHSIVILVLIFFWGVLGYIAQALFKVLQEVEHHMKTGFG